MAATATRPAQAAFERLMARYAAGLRGGSAIAAGIAAVVGLAPPASPGLVGVAIAGLLAWAGSYAAAALTRGWTRWLVAGDIAVAAALCLAHPRLVPADVLTDGSSWVFVVASTTVIISQLCPRPVLGVAATVLVTGAHAGGLLLAGRTGSFAFSVVLALQGVLVGSLMGFLRGASRAADAAITEHEAVERDAAVRAARRAEERAHLWLQHDSVSATLTVVSAGGVAGTSPALRAQARRDLEVIERIRAPSTDPPLGRPAAGGPPGPGLGDVVATRYGHRFDLAVVWLVGFWYVGGDLGTAVLAGPTYRSLAAEVAAVVLITGIGVAGAVRLLRRRTRPGMSRLLAAGALAASALAAAGVPGSAVFTASWAWDATGWIGVLLLLRRPLVELAALLAANSGLTLAVLLHDGGADRISLARFATVLYATSVLQLAVALAARALDTTARRATLAAEAEAAVRRRRQVAEQVHASRQGRYQTVRQALTPLLAGLATAALDAADRSTQRRCAVEASRLRRLFAETDDVPDPLLHELRACTDVADRRGVLVDLQVLGRLPALDLAVRRELTEAPMHALAAAEREARVTVMARSDEVAVSVLAGGRIPDPADLPAPAEAGVAVTRQQGEDQRWVEARWRRG
jgi:hypothetical protein